MREVGSGLQLVSGLQGVLGAGRGEGKAGVLGPKSALTVSWRASAAERLGAPPPAGLRDEKAGLLCTKLCLLAGPQVCPADVRVLLRGRVSGGRGPRLRRRPGGEQGEAGRAPLAPVTPHGRAGGDDVPQLR